MSEVDENCNKITDNDAVPVVDVQPGNVEVPEPPDNKEGKYIENEKPSAIPDDHKEGQLAATEADEVDVVLEGDESAVDEQNESEEEPEMSPEEKAAMNAAVKSGDIDTLDDLLDLPGADINMTWFSENLLMAAIRAHQQKLAEFLVDNGIDYNFKSTRVEFSPDGTGQALDWFTVDCRQMAYERELSDIVDLIDEKNGNTWANIPPRVRHIRYKKPLEEKLRERDAQELETECNENQSKHTRFSDSHNSTIQGSLESISTERGDKSSGYCSDVAPCPSNSDPELHRRGLTTKQHNPDIRKRLIQGGTKTSLSRCRVNTEYAHFLSMTTTPRSSTNKENEYRNRWARPREHFPTHIKNNISIASPQVYVAQKRIKSAPCLEQMRTSTKMNLDSRQRAKTAVVRCTTVHKSDPHSVLETARPRVQIYPDIYPLSRVSSGVNNYSKATKDVWKTGEINLKASGNMLSSREVHKRPMPLGVYHHTHVRVLSPRSVARIGLTTEDRVRHWSSVQGVVDLGAVARHRGMTSPKLPERVSKSSFFND